MRSWRINIKTEVEEEGAPPIPEGCYLVVPAETSELAMEHASDLLDVYYSLDANSLIPIEA